MPEICRFFGIVVKMFFGDHSPPHFHTYYGEHEALIDIHNLSIFAGRLPPRAIGLVMEWANIYQKELLDDWNRAQHHQPILTIAPLE
jgi:hypothetical protein